MYIVQHPEESTWIFYVLKAPRALQVPVCVIHGPEAADAGSTLRKAIIAPGGETIYAPPVYLLSDYL
jgi:hypothetical protein